MNILPYRFMTEGGRCQQMAVIILLLKVYGVRYREQNMNRVKVYGVRHHKYAIVHLYRTYRQCMINKDIAGMDRIMADDYELRHMTGLRQSKQDFFRSVTSGELNYYSAKHDEITVKVSGETATMIGRSKVVAAVYGGGRNTWRLQGNFTLRKEDGGWRLTSSRASTY